jgi:hypothetical protein
VDLHKESQGVKGCRLGYKQCGSGDPDHSICVKKEQSCPINQISSEPIPNGKELKLRDGKTLYFGSEGTSLPIVRFTLTEESVCADKREFDVAPGRTYYTLLD